MKLLFVDACPRDQQVSRTYRLCKAFLEAYQEANPEAQIECVRLSELHLEPYDGESVARRDSLIDAGQLTGPMFALARQFAEADRILVGAPYWDFSFPAVLKLYIEHIFAKTITFVYEDDQCVGLCRATRAAYITTAGSPIGENNWGGEYTKSVFGMLGIHGFDQISAEGIDILGCDVAAILHDAQQQAGELARVF